LMMEALCSFETLVLLRATRRNIPENGNLQDFNVCNIKRVKLYIQIVTAETKANFFAAYVGC
jgi:hypothetical protein